jgi:hypothetical protein
MSMQSVKILIKLAVTVSIGVHFMLGAAALAAIETEGIVPTNMAVLERLSGDAISEIIVNMPTLDGGRTVSIRKDRGVGEGDFVFETMIVRQFDEAGYRVILERPVEADSTPPGDRYRLSYQIIEMSLAYPRIGRRHWFGRKEVERNAEIDIFAQLVDLASGEVVWVGEARKEYSDVIGYSALDQVEDDEYEFTKPQRKELRWSKIVEPVVVTGIVVGLVYLFFSNQSNE